MFLPFKSIPKIIGFWFAFLFLPAHASDMYFLTRDGYQIELPKAFKNVFNTIIISESNYVKSEDMPSAFFWPVGKFVMNEEEYSFYLFHVQSKKTGYYYKFVLSGDRKYILHQLKSLIFTNRKLNQADIDRLKELFWHLSLEKKRLH